VWRLRAAGYRTVCVHPFDTRFYGRRAVLPKLGFSTIIGPEAFAPPAPGGYVSDLAVAACVRGLLERYGKRLFVFVVTMQTHGPWTASALPGEAGSGGGELHGYLAALRAADTALPVLRAAVDAQDGVLAIYGDHQPSLGDDLAAGGITESDTDYLIWHGPHGGAARRDLRAEQLAAAVCDIAAGGSARAQHAALLRVAA
jgi:phosphoglycerol transferase MdoB-like AlkP superfamily enzyme